MTWDRRSSRLEELMVSILKRHSKSLTMQEIAALIAKREPDAFVGKTPDKSLYSIVYRNEKRREERGEPTLFKAERDDLGRVFYQLNSR